MLFEGHWYCSPECAETRVRLRLLDGGSTGRARETTHRIPLGLMLLSHGRLNSSQLQCGLERQRDAGHGRIGEWLQSLGYVKDRDVIAALAAQWSCPMMKADFHPSRTTLSLVPQSLQERFAMVPVHFSSITHVLYVGFEQQIDYSLLYAIGHMLDCRAEPCIISHADWLKNRRDHRASVDVVFCHPCDADETARIVRSYLARYGSCEMRMARLRSGVWFRLRSGDTAGDILFDRISSETPSGHPSQTLA